MKRKIQAVKPQKKEKANKIEVKIGYASCPAAEISGDAVISCGLPGGSRALILSDGMGKGIKAAAGSRLVVRRLRKNLKEGMPVARAIKEVNRYMIEQALRLYQKGKSCDTGVCEEFATVDLTIIDQLTCRARFYKMGAATSFLVRDGKVRRIAREALPIGIIPSLKLTHISARLKAGDIIVMVSDGITEADRNDMEAWWLEEYLSNFVETAMKEFRPEPATKEFRQAAEVKERSAAISPRQLASEILAMASSRYGERERDDLTVAAVIIEDSGSDT